MASEVPTDFPKVLVDLLRKDSKNSSLGKCTKSPTDTVNEAKQTVANSCQAYRQQQDAASTALTKHDV